MGSRYHSNCAPLHTTLRTLSCPMPLRSIHGRRLQGSFRSDLRLGSDGMKLQPAGSHHSRLSAGPPAVPSSSQPCMKLRAFYHRENGLSILWMYLDCSLPSFPYGTPAFFCCCSELTGRRRCSYRMTSGRLFSWKKHLKNPRGYAIIDAGKPARALSKTLKLLL